MTANPIPGLMRRFTPGLRDEAARRFGMAPDALVELEGTAFVYEGLAGDRPAILKVTPGLADPGPVMGATRAELEAEVDFIRHLVAHGVPAAASIPSLAGRDVEELPLGDGESFLAYCFEKAPGEMFPDDDITVFPDGVVREWGRVLGMMHRIGSGFSPRPGTRRRGWRDDDLLDSRSLVPACQAGVHRRFDEAIAALEARDEDPEAFGMVHGDFHHGNFLAAGERLTVIDFDGAKRGWFAMDLATALFNCLPMPRSLAAERREYALRFLRLALEGYRRERTPHRSLVRDLPAFLFLNELMAYAYRYKYWEPSELERRAAYIDSIRQRIEAGEPVVRFSEEDLRSLEEIALAPRP